MRKTVVFLSLAFLACCCTTPEKSSNATQDGIPDRPLYAASPIAALLDSLRPATRHFSIRADRDTVLVGNDQVFIAIPAHTFINAAGEIVQGKIDLEMVEAISFGDMIAAGLQTVAQDQILQTSGMIYINASSNGERLDIRKEKPITIDIPARTLNIGAQIFTGKFDARGNMDWTQKSDLEKSLLPIPLELLDFGYHHYCEGVYEKRNIEYLNSKKFENTYIATQEFELRMNVFSHVTCGDNTRPLEEQIIRIYTSNTDRDLYVADSVFMTYVLTHYRDDIDTTLRAPDTGEAYDSIGLRWPMTEFYQDIVDFYNQRLTRPIDFAALGITEATTIDQLIQAGHAQDEATRLISLYKVRQQKIQARQAEIRNRTTEEKVARMRSTFPITELGWVNVDRFMNDPQARESQFTVKVNAKDSLDFIAIHLIIPDYNIVLTGWKQAQGDYTFTEKEEDIYRKLPVGKMAGVVGLSYKDETPYFGIQVIRIPAKGVVHLNLKPASAKHIAIQLTKMR